MDALRAVQKYIPRLEEDMEALKIQAKAQAETEGGVVNQDFPEADHSKHLCDVLGTISESEDLSDIFDTEGSDEGESKSEDGDKRQNLYLDQINSLLEDRNQEREPVLSLERKAEEFKEMDEIDRIFLQATVLLRRKGRVKK